MTLLGVIGRSRQIIQSIIKNLKTSLNCYEDNTTTICTDAILIASNDEVLVIDGEMLNPYLDLIQSDIKSLLLNNLILLVKWKKSSKELWLASDIFALRRLYYTVHEKNFIFSSDLESLVKALNVKNINEKILKSYLLYGFVQPPYTLFTKVFKLRPAELLYINFKENKLTSSRYYELNVQTNMKIKLIDALSIVKIAIEEAIHQATYKKGLRYAILLSGGLDSSTIAAVARKYVENIVAITLLNTGEGDAVRHLCDYLNLPLTEVYISEDEFLKVLEPSFKLLQEPLAGIDIVPSTYLLLKEAKRIGADVILTGDGGDEAFFGYPWVFKDEIKYAIIGSFPRWCSLTLKICMEQLSNYSAILHRGIQHLALENALSRRLNANESFKHDEPIARWYRRSYDIITFNSRGTQRVEDIAHKFGLKTSYPFLNRNFIEKLYLIPTKFKQPTMHETKYILRLYLLHNNLLPKDIVLSKRKIGLASNIWFSRRLVKEYFKILVENISPYIKLDTIEKIARAKDYQVLSALVGFTLWYKKYR